ncbi:MAG: HAMP domain-containing histidine kinase [Lachnospiraceae bacterium]|nr:HAMP domain-containing histidine kinase [Lachnospiraceae bacterium]
MSRLKIFPKTFLYTLSLMLIIVLLSHTLIYFLMPWAYNYQQEKALETDAAQLVQKITAALPGDRLNYVTAFATKWSANVSVVYDDFTYCMDLLEAETDTVLSPDGKTDVTIIASTTEDGLKISLAENPKGGTDFFKVEQGFANGTGSITAVVSRQHIEDAISAVLMIFPFTAILCTIISILFAFVYSKMFTRPIRHISTATEQMRELEPAACCLNDTQDEIGMLADNVNSLYQTLLSTIQKLEQEIEKVEAADIQKSNFLRAASHELKTPVTAVSAMLENMILGIGRYKDRDTYLAKCKALTDRLAQMIKEILDASRAEFAEEQEQSDFLIADVLETVMEPYQIIAKAKGITVNIELGEPFTAHLPQRMIEKAISNILANAVSYTKPGGMIDVSCKGRQLVIENECTPIPPEHLAHIFEPFYRPDYGRDRASGGNGLGLYLVSTILESLDISYSFTPSENINGMSFQISF